MSHQAITSVLADFGVHVGFPLERHQLAMKLLDEGFADADLAMVAQHVEQTVDAAGAGAVLASLLNGNPEALRARIVDVKRFAAAKAQRNAPTPQPYPGEVDHQHITPEDSARFARLDEARQARMAYCRAIADRVDRDTVAKEIGVPVALLDGLIQKGFEMQGGRDEMPSGKPVPKRRKEVKK
jgi:hypothetical protein